MNSYTLELKNGNELLIDIFKSIAEKFKAELKIKTKKPQLTINGFTKEFEEEILAELKETKKLAKENKIPVYDTDEKFYKHLADEYGYKAEK